MVKSTRKRHSEEFKAEVLALADTVGVSAAATQLGLHSSQIYGWRSKAQLLESRGQIARKTHHTDRNRPQSRA